MPHPSKRESDLAILARIRAKGASGAMTSEFPELDAGALGGAITRLTARGEVFKAKLGHRTMYLFAELAWASAFTAKYRTSNSDPGPVSHKRTRASWPADAPIHYPKNPDGSNAFKFTVCKGWERDPSMPIRTTHYQPV